MVLAIVLVHKAIYHKIAIVLFVPNNARFVCLTVVWLVLKVII